MVGEKKKGAWICGMNSGLDQDDGGRLPHRIRQSWSFARNHDNRNIDCTNRRQNREVTLLKLEQSVSRAKQPFPLCRSSLEVSRDTRTYNARQ